MESAITMFLVYDYSKRIKIALNSLSLIEVHSYPL
jgi:hypothetical protein